MTGIPFCWNSVNSAQLMFGGTRGIDLHRVAEAAAGTGRKPPGIRRDCVRRLPLPPPSPPPPPPPSASSPPRPPRPPPSTGKRARSSAAPAVVQEFPSTTHQPHEEPHIRLDMDGANAHPPASSNTEHARGCQSPQLNNALVRRCCPITASSRQRPAEKCRCMPAPGGLRPGSVAAAAAYSARSLCNSCTSASARVFTWCKRNKSTCFYVVNMPA